MVRSRVRRRQTTVESPIARTMPDIIEEEVVETDTPVAAVTTEPEYEFMLAKVNQVIWSLLMIVILLISLRFFFLLAGANNVGFIAAIYDLTNVLVAPFRGVFDSASYGESFFDAASVLAILVWIVTGFIITTLISLLSARDPS